MLSPRLVARPNPSCSALCRQDTHLHGAPTMEEDGELNSNNNVSNEIYLGETKEKKKTRKRNN